MRHRGWRKRTLPMLLAAAMVMGSMDMTAIVSQAEINAYEAATEVTVSDGNGLIVGTTASDYINLEEKSTVTDGVLLYVAADASDATVTYDAESVAVTASSWGQQDWWSIQWAVQDLDVTAGEWIVEYDIISTIDKPVMSKLTSFGSGDVDAPIIDETYDLTANVSKHYSEVATISADGKVRLFFNLAGGTGEGTVTISNVRVYQPADDYINLEEKSQTTDGILLYVAADASDATVAYEEEAATVTASSWGQQDWWSIQWAVQDLDVTAGKWLVEYDIISTIDKPVMSKLTSFGSGDVDAPIIDETYDLTANVSKHYSEVATISADGKVRLFFNLAGGTGEGSVTISNVKLTKVLAEDAPVLSNSKISKTDGYVVGGENPVLSFTDNADWRNAVSAVKVNNKTLDAANYTFAEGTLTLNNSIFTKEGVYTVEVEANGYNVSSIKLPIYDAAVASENWTVAWEDQFNGTELDTTKWSYEIGVRSGDDTTSSAAIYWGNNEKQYYTEESVSVKDGYLVITGDKLTQDTKDKYGITDTFVEYSSGRIRTITDEGNVLAATTYGRIEASMILPAGQGYWPAFWMLPATDYYGVWASSGEIDIMEARGSQPTAVNGTIHYGGQWPNNISTEGTYTFPNDGNITEEHVYAVEWEPGELRWYVDDVLYRVENNWYGMDANGEKYTYPAPFDEDFYILFNLAMSGNYVSNELPLEEELGRQLKVNYVRILTDENADYEKEVTAPTTERDTEFFEENGGYVDLIQDKEYTTLADHAFGDGADVVPGIGYWSSAVNTGAGAQATVEVVDGAAKIDVTKVGSNDYNIQLIQNIPLAKGYTYRITFDAWTDLSSGRGIVVAPKGDADNSWVAYDAGINAALTTTKKTFTYDFTMTSDSDPTARLEMNLGGALGSVSVDNVSVIALTDEQLSESEENGAKEPLSNGEHIYNGTFDKGNGKLGYWTVEATQGSTENRNYTVTIGADGAKLAQDGIQFLEQDEYELTFDASTLGTGKVLVTLTEESGETVYATKEYELSTTTETYTLGFTVPEGKATDMGRLVFEFVGEGETVTIDNVSMIRLTNVALEWDAYEFYPIGTDGMTDFTTYDEVWTWAENTIEATDIGNGEKAFVVETAPAGENWKVLLQHKNAALAKGMTYRIQYAIKSSVAEQPVQIKIEDTNYSPCYDANLIVGTEWTYIDATFTSTLAGAGDLKFCLAGVDQECTIYVKDVSMVMAGIPMPQFVEGAEISEMTVGETAKLDVEYSVKVQDKYLEFTYESSATDVIEVAADGTMTAKVAGKATITVTSVLGTTFSFEVTVSEDDATGDDTTGDDTTGDDTTGDDTTGDDATGDDTTGDNTTDDNNSGNENTQKPSDKLEQIIKDAIKIVIGESTPNIKINSLRDLLEAIFSKEEIAQIEAGADFGVKLEINKNNLPIQSEKEAVEKILGDKKVAAYFDIDLFKDESGKLTAITELNSAVRLTLDIPKEVLANNRTFHMIRVHNGEATLLQDLDSDANTITFETDRFSTYTLVYEDSAEDENNNNSNQNGNNDNTENKNTQSEVISPKTGDNIIWIWTIMALVTGIVIVIVAKKYSYRKEEM